MALDSETSPSRHAVPWFGKSVLALKNDKPTLELSSFYSGEVSHENLAFEEQTKTFVYGKDANGNTYAPSWYNLNLRAMVSIRISGKYQVASKILLKSPTEGIAQVSQQLVAM